MNRLVLFASIVITTFVVGVWASRGFPVTRNTTFVQPLSPTIDSTFGSNESYDRFQKRRAHQVEEAVKNPENTKLNPLRMDVLQAATGYALSPCDKTMKANLVSVLRTYAAGYNDLSKCNPMFGNCGLAYDKASAAYGTPLDLQVSAALHEAFERGGISKDDFPPPIQMSVMTLANSQGSPTSACAISTARRP